MGFDTGAARAPQTDRYVGPGWGIDDLQKHYSRLNLVALKPHYYLVTLMDHMGSSLDRLEVDRGDAEPQRFVSSHLNSAFALCDRPLLKADPCKPW